MLKLVWERWKKVPELDNVKVSSLGNVKINGKLVRPKVNNKGYFVVEVEDKLLLVHRLVAKAFLKHNLERYETIDHIDSNRRNNALSNLEIVSQEENMRRAAENLVVQPESLQCRPDMPDWTIRITDGRAEFKSLKRACNALMNETGWSRERAIQDILGTLLFGVKGSRKWKIVK